MVNYKSSEVTSKFWMFFNCYRKTITGIFETKEAATIRANRDGNRLTNGCLVYGSYEDQNLINKFGTDVIKNQITLDSSKREPIVVTSVAEFDKYMAE